MNLQKEMLYTAKDGTIVLLRYPLKKDSMQLMNLINELIDEHAPIGANKKVNRKQEEEYVRKAIKEIKEKKRIQFLAEIDKNIAANIGINRLYGKSMHVGELGIFIKKLYRDKGIGEFMVQQALKYAHKAGIKMVKLSVFANNDRAIHLYKKLGFKKVGLLKGALKDKGKYFDEIIMVKYIG
ncbi:GNAT family N-acetyltransferase [Candidatus Parvarchaeota archaeon]|jgi:RimJ/RimL family protein N-acetyltransferase|nr:GNAT family N-acetyltransferase [Candidatus Parvarchaeota archaeon]